jgi:hypothetical protein
MYAPVRLLMVPVCLAAFAVSALGASSVPRIPAASAADSIAVAKVVNDFHAALSTGDKAKALSLLAPDAVILESGGIESRAEYASHHLPEDIEFAKAVGSSPGPVQVTVDGKSAWTAGTSTTVGQFKGRTINSVSAESMVLTKRDGVWRIRSIHWSSRKRE